MKNCGHGLDHDASCGECGAYSRMYRLDHKTTLAEGEGDELRRLERYFGAVPADDRGDAVAADAVNEAVARAAERINTERANAQAEATKWEPGDLSRRVNARLQPVAVQQGRTADTAEVWFAVAEVGEQAQADRLAGLEREVFGIDPYAAHRAEVGGARISLKYARDDEERDWARERLASLGAGDAAGEAEAALAVAEAEQRAAGEAREDERAGDDDAAGDRAGEARIPVDE